MRVGQNTSHKTSAYFNEARIAFQLKQRASLIRDVSPKNRVMTRVKSQADSYPRNKRSTKDNSLIQREKNHGYQSHPVFKRKNTDSRKSSTPCRTSSMAGPMWLSSKAEKSLDQVRVKHPQEIAKLLDSNVSKFRITIA